MENPTFKLEGVVKAKENMEDFEGPLILILQLLSKNKIEIKDIQVSVLLDQYLAYLDEMKSMDLEIASEFVAMASHLVYIKTKTLLSTDEEVSELEELITSLENLKARDTYARIKGVTDTLAEMFKRGAGLFTKPEETLPADKQYRYVHHKNDLLEALGRVFEREDAVLAPANNNSFVVPGRIVYSVTEKAQEILARVRKCGVFYVKPFFKESRSRSELVATFIAMLELCKAGRIALTEVQDDFMVSFTGRAEEIDIGAVFEENEENGNS